jgi:hypothetical protein
MKRLFAIAILALALTGCILPPGLRVYVSDTGCTPDASYCAGHPANYYDPVSRTVVLAPGQGLSTIVHELCHARQHEVVLEALGREPDVALTQWYLTNEATAFIAATGWVPDGGWDEHGPTFYPLPLPDGLGLWAFNPLEDSAGACAHYLLGQPQEAAREQWAETWVR